MRKITGNLKARAFTLVELMVAVSILILIVLSFNTILTQSQKVVMRSQTRMRSNAAATAIADVLRNDLRNITQNGFLCIKQADDNTPQIIFCTAGPVASMTGTGRGALTVVTYGLSRKYDVVRRALSDNQYVFYRNCYIIDTTGTGTGDDVWNGQFPSEQFTPNSDSGVIGQYVDYMTTGAGPSRDNPNDRTTIPHVPTELVSVPETLNQVQGLWKYIDPNCICLSIAWTEGDVDDPTNNNNLIWHSIDPQYNGALYTGANSPYVYAFVPWPPPVIPPSMPYIRTSKDQSNWPKAIRFRFSLASDQPGGRSDYEVICAVGQ